MAESPTTSQVASAGERLQRVLAARGVASRRQAEALIRAGRVTVNGQKVTELGTRVMPDQAKIRVDGKLIQPNPDRYFMLNKPSGFITSMHDERGRPTVMELVPQEPRVFPVGRLDRDTEGLLLFTNDGELANRIAHPRYGLAKEYSVLTPRKPSESTMRRVRSGIRIDDRLVVPDAFRVVRETPKGVLLSIVLHEGLNRVVRRMMDEVGIQVDLLRRERIGPLSLAGIDRGKYRELTRGELASLREALHFDATQMSLASDRDAVPEQRSSARGNAKRQPRKEHGKSTA